MNNIKREIFGSTMSLKKTLETYGIDRYNTKEDIILLSLIDDILSQNCYFSFLNQCSLTNILRMANCIRNKNPQLKYCRIDLNDYINLGDKQNIDTYKLIKGRTN